MDWSASLHLDVTLDYINRFGIRQRQHAFIYRADYYLTPELSPRLRLMWRRMNAIGGRETDKTQGSCFLHRLCAFIDPRTGEVYEDTRTYLSSALQQLGLPQPPDWPVMGTVPFQTSDFDITFGPDGLVADWFFAVPSSFRVALGITPNPGERGWLRRVPPVLSFEIGDSFHAPARLPEKWEVQRHWLNWTIQVDADFGEQGISVVLREWRAGEVVALTYYAIAQETLESVLRHGPAMLDGCPCQATRFKSWPDMGPRDEGRHAAP